MHELERLRQLRRAGDEEGYLAGVLDLARRRPSDAEVRIEAAYASDRYGTEEEAIRHYDAAWELGVPADERRHFLVGYGSTLRNVGRAEEAVALLGEAVASYPDYAPLKAFLALALHAHGHADAALAAMLDVVLDAAASGPLLDGYERALGFYRDELLERALQR